MNDVKTLIDMISKKIDIDGDIDAQIDAKYHPMDELSQLALRDKSRFSADDVEYIEKTIKVLLVDGKNMYWELEVLGDVYLKLTGYKGLPLAAEILACSTHDFDGLNTEINNTLETASEETITFLQESKLESSSEATKEIDQMIAMLAK